LADLDGSKPECAQVCALHIESRLATLRKIEMAAVLCTNETTPQFFFEFLTPLSRPPGADGPHRWTEQKNKKKPAVKQIPLPSANGE